MLSEVAVAGPKLIPLFAPELAAAIEFCAAIPRTPCGEFTFRTPPTTLVDSSTNSKWFRSEIIIGFLLNKVMVGIGKAR
jgi:hypothetical protein